ncbi:uncharacterized protein LOC117102150 [Anneissia japonica]|uniref:uncharacterized protein LOC117102150 n=1 Tax=Anneissia japonica TaxID=1529436 RepID=UPI0014257400|nr:uncharacterized protein LOC117102150 [Anneissia japonica]
MSENFLQLNKDKTEFIIFGSPQQRKKCQDLHFNIGECQIDQRSMHRLQLLQNTSARIITGTKKFEHITPILQELHWLPVSFRSIFKILLITFKTLRDEGPGYLRELLVWYVPSRTLHSCTDKLLLVEPRSTRSWGDRSFALRLHAFGINCQ